MIADAYGSSQPSRLNSDSVKIAYNNDLESSKEDTKKNTLFLVTVFISFFGSVFVVAVIVVAVRLLRSDSNRQYTSSKLNSSNGSSHKMIFPECDPKYERPSFKSKVLIG